MNATGVWVDALRQMDTEAIGEAKSNPPWSRPARACTSSWTGNFAIRPRADGAQDGRRAGVVCRALAGQGHPGHHRQSAQRSGARAAPSRKKCLHPGESARIYRGAQARKTFAASGWACALVKPQDEDGKHTKSLSREQYGAGQPSGLVTVTGGKWTTYRAMAEDVLQKCFDQGLLPKPAGVTISFRWSAPTRAPVHAASTTPSLHLYGNQKPPAAGIAREGAKPFGPGADRNHGALRARSNTPAVEDVLARRSRLLFLDAAAAIDWPGVAAILQEDRAATRAGGRSSGWRNNICNCRI